jgi:hypothetical protein
MLELFLYSSPPKGTSLLVASSTVVAGEARPMDINTVDLSRASLQQRFYLVHPAYHRHKGAFTFKRSSRQREMFLSSLEFSYTDRSSSFPYPRVGEP